MILFDILIFLLLVSCTHVKAHNSANDRNLTFTPTTQPSPPNALGPILPHLRSSNCTDIEIIERFMPLVKQVEMKLLTHKPLNHTEIYIWDTVSAAIGLIMNTSLVNQFNTTNNATGEIRPALCAKILVGQPIGFCVYQDILEQEPFSGLRYFYFSCAEGSGGGVAVRKPNSDEWYSISISFSDDDMLVGTRTAIGGVQELEIYVDLMNMNCIPSVAATLCTQFVRFHHPLPCVLYLIN